MTLIPQLGKKYRLINTHDYSKGKLNRVVTVHALEQEEDGSYRGFLSCGGNTTHHSYQDEGNWCLFFNNMQDCLEKTDMKLEVGKKYRLTDKYWYDDNMVGKEVVYLGDNEGRVDNIFDGSGYLSCGGVKEHHRHKDENHWCLHFSNLHNSLEEIEETEEEYPMRREMTIKEKKDGTFTVRMSREELLFIWTICGWVGGEPWGSRRHASKFYTLADDYFYEEEKDAEIEKFEDDTHGIYVKDGK